MKTLRLLGFMVVGAGLTAISSAGTIYEQVLTSSTLNNTFKFGDKVNVEPNLFPGASEGVLTIKNILPTGLAQGSDDATLNYQLYYVGNSATDAPPSTIWITVTSNSSANVIANGMAFGSGESFQYYASAGSAGASAYTPQVSVTGNEEAPIMEGNSMGSNAVNAPTVTSKGVSWTLFSSGGGRYYYKTTSALSVTTPSVAVDAYAWETGGATVTEFSSAELGFAVFFTATKPTWVG